MKAGVIIKGDLISFIMDGKKLRSRGKNNQRAKGHGARD